VLQKAVAPDLCDIGKVLWWTSGAIAVGPACKNASHPTRRTSVSGGVLFALTIVVCALLHCLQRWQRHLRQTRCQQTRSVVKCVQEVHEEEEEQEEENRQPESEREAGDSTDGTEFHLPSSVQQERQLRDLSVAGSEATNLSSRSLFESASLNSAVGDLERPDTPRESSTNSVVPPLLAPDTSTAPCTQQLLLGISGSSADSANRWLPLPQAPTCTDSAPASTAPCDHQPPGGLACSNNEEYVPSLPKRLLPLLPALQSGQLAQSGQIPNSLGTMRRVVSDEPRPDGPRRDLGILKLKGVVRAVTTQLEQRCAARNDAEEAQVRIPKKVRRPQSNEVGRPASSPSSEA